MGLEAARIYAVVGADTRGFARGMAGASAGVQGFAGRTRAVLSGVGGFISKWGKRAALGVAAVTIAASGAALLDAIEAAPEISSPGNSEEDPSWL